MKKFILAAVALMSVNAFSQSYMVLSNGVTLTTDKAGFVYDFNHFVLPYKVTLNGGQFLGEDERLVTIDSNGFVYEKGKKIEKVKAKGNNYLVNDDKLITIDSKGFFYEYDKESKNVFKKIVKTGGNFFLVKPEDRRSNLDLYTVTASGNYIKVNVPGLVNTNIENLGGNYFQTTDGVVYTISDEGFVFSKAEVKAARIKRMGGNFFVDAQNRLYTVSDKGFLILPVLPANIKVADIQKIGQNYMIDSEGRIFVVDSLGNILERTINHDLTNAKILSL